jgi:hypothetical protein
MINHAMDFYKNLFGKEQRSIRLEDDFWGEEERERVTAEENEALEAEFSEEEIRKAIF